MRYAIGLLIILGFVPAAVAAHSGIENVGCGGEKGLVLRDTKRHPSPYTAAREEARTQGGLIRDLIHKAFAGSTRILMIRAVEEGGLSAKELREIRRVIDNARKPKPGGKA